MVHAAVLSTVWQEKLRGQRHGLLPGLHQNRHWPNRQHCLRLQDWRGVVSLAVECPAPVRRGWHSPSCCTVRILGVDATRVSVLAWSSAQYMLRCTSSNLQEVTQMFLWRAADRISLNTALVEPSVSTRQLSFCGAVVVKPMLLSPVS